MQRRMKRRSLLISLGIIALASAITFAPVPGLQRKVIVVGGTELQEVLPTLEAKFEQQNPSIDLEFRFQGSQDVVNNYIDDKNDFTPTVLIPASGDLITELSDRWRAQNGDEAFYDAPRPIAKTVLVAIAWEERGQFLFADGQFQWRKLERALEIGNWRDINGFDFGSFDLVMTDPTRSNSSQLALSLWAQSKTGGTLSPGNLNNDPAIASLFGLVKRSVYQPPRSTDVLLQEFITRGPNDADVAIVYESIALHRWQQSSTTQSQPYQIYYIDPTVETVSTGAIVRRNVDSGTADAARRFLDFLAQPEQQAVFVQYGFRPVDGSTSLRSVPGSPWSQNIPGARIDPPGVTPIPDRDTLTEVIRLWQRAS
ncbi:substrate-binding domain-containing protein [Oscillatoria sp. FACHB-1407]|nr:substrate-binding domain-containing protein [Oscillatoria sp. FACHB-1407]